MALPLLLALMAASAGANYMGQRKVDKGRAVALREAENRRKQAEARSRLSAESTTNLLVNAGRNQGAKAAELEAKYAASAPPPNATATPQFGGFTAPAGSTFTVGDDQRALDRVRADTDALAKAKAGLSAYGDAMVGAQIGANRNLTDIEQQNTGVRNWNQYVLPARLNSANASGQDWSMLADAIQMASAIYAPTALAKGAVANVANSATAANAVGTPAVGGGLPFMGQFTRRPF